MPVVEIPGMSGVEGTREETRMIMAIIAIAGFMIILLAIIIGYLCTNGAKIDDTLKLITSISSILSGIVGAIIGFYFRSQEK